MGIWYSSYTRNQNKSNSNTELLLEKCEKWVIVNAWTGFVSYDNPTVAQVAIKAMDGCQVGNKKLKVEHKKVKNRDSTSSSSSSNSSSNCSITSASLNTRSPSGDLRINVGSSLSSSDSGMDSKYHHSISNNSDLSFIQSGRETDHTAIKESQGLKGGSGIEDPTTSAYFSSPFFMNTPNFGLLSSGGKANEKPASYEDLLWRS